MDIKIMVATHKKYWMPTDDMYLPIHVGKQGEEALGYIGDDTGDNISCRNDNYCELTALYWGWKNLKNDYVGLVHYRRHFSRKIGRKSLNRKRECVLRKYDLEQVLKTVDIVLPKRRKYYIETNRSHYNHAHNRRDLDMTEEIIKEIYPNYHPSFQDVMQDNSAHMFNMFIMRKSYFDEYCTWLFSILFELERRVKENNYFIEVRLYGYISEILLDVWIETKGIKYKEVDFMFMEKQNWWEKGGNFLKRKFLGR